MGAAEIIEECCQYIEEHLQDELSAMELAKKYHYSYYHFCRIFHVLKDVSVVEYIRNRRLTVATLKIENGSNILDAALSVGFETPSGFTKAFKRKYGCTPTEFFQSRNKGENKMNEPRIMEMDPIYVLGHKRASEVKTQDENAGAYWYQDKPKHGHGHGHMEADTVKIGLWLKEADEDGNLPYFFGRKTEEKTSPHECLSVVEIPGGTYAVFTTEPLDVTEETGHQAFVEKIRETWKYIYRTWMDNSGYVFDENGYDFEYYDTRCADKKACCMDIYVAVKKA